MKLCRIHLPKSCANFAQTSTPPADWFVFWPLPFQWLPCAMLYEHSTVSQVPHLKSLYEKGWINLWKSNAQTVHFYGLRRKITYRRERRARVGAHRVDFALSIIPKRPKLLYSSIRSCSFYFLLFNFSLPYFHVLQSKLKTRRIFLCSKAFRASNLFFESHFTSLWFRQRK